MLMFVQHNIVKTSIWGGQLFSVLFNFYTKYTINFKFYYQIALSGKEINCAIYFQQIMEQWYLQIVGQVTQKTSTKIKKMV